MIDQSHKVTDPIESLISSAIEIQRADAQALLVDRAGRADLRQARDAMMANQALKRAFTTDASPILAMARFRKGLPSTRSRPVGPAATGRRAPTGARAGPAAGWRETGSRLGSGSRQARPARGRFARAAGAARQPRSTVSDSACDQPASSGWPNSRRR